MSNTISQNRSKTYWVEVWENGKAKIIPHTPKKKLYEFITRADATTFRDELVLSNPKNKFRICRKTILLTKENWCSTNKRLQNKQP